MADGQNAPADQGSDMTPGMEGAPIGGGDGGFGPEGDYSGTGGQPNAEVLGEVGGDPDALAAEARKLGHPRADRMWTGGTPPNAGER